MFTLLLMALTLGVQAQQTFTVSVTNPLTTARTDQPVIISLTPFGDIRSALITTCGQEIPCQLDDLNQDDTFDELCVLADLNGDETKLYEVTLLSEGEPRTYPARVYTDMLLRNDKVKEKNKHNNFIESITARGDCADSYHIQHHHGVEFESELNGIRIYFDKRQTLDLYGKFQKRLELQATQFYTSKEQKAEGYGDDVLWVGNTFGLGAFRGWDGQKPTMIDPVRSRTQRISYARQMAMYLAEQLTNTSHMQIGRLIGNRNHATVIHALKQIKDMMAVEEKVREDVEELMMKIKALQ